jgi:hypothetical protein
MGITQSKSYVVQFEVSGDALLIIRVQLVSQHATFFAKRPVFFDVLTVILIDRLEHGKK